jgi:hypothetical protein
MTVGLLMILTKCLNKPMGSGIIEMRISDVYLSQNFEVLFWYC